MKIIASEDCGNSPKNIFVQDLTIALTKCDSRYILETVTEDVHWNILGEQYIEGKENVAAALKRWKDDKVSELVIQHVATHGKAGAVNGIRKWANGKKVAFCDFYEFGNTKGTLVKEIRSYRIEIS
jgi:hypothetical protein